MTNGQTSMCCLYFQNLQQSNVMRTARGVVAWMEDYLCYRQHLPDHYDHNHGHGYDCCKHDHDDANDLFVSVVPVLSWTPSTRDMVSFVTCWFGNAHYHADDQSSADDNRDGPTSKPSSPPSPSPLSPSLSPSPTLSTKCSRWMCTVQPLIHQ